MLFVLSCVVTDCGCKPNGHNLIFSVTSEDLRSCYMGHFNAAVSFILGIELFPGQCWVLVLSPV